MLKVCVVDSTALDLKFSDIFYSGSSRSSTSWSKASDASLAKEGSIPGYIYVAKKIRPFDIIRYDGSGRRTT